jgi:hypothetical protein
MLKSFSLKKNVFSFFQNLLEFVFTKAGFSKAFVPHVPGMNNKLVECGHNHSCRQQKFSCIMQTGSEKPYSDFIAGKV